MPSEAVIQAFSEMGNIAEGLVKGNEDYYVWYGLWKGIDDEKECPKPEANVVYIVHRKSSYLEQVNKAHDYVENEITPKYGDSISEIMGSRETTRALFSKVPLGESPVLMLRKRHNTIKYKINLGNRIAAEFCHRLDSGWLELMRHTTFRNEMSVYRS